MIADITDAYRTVTQCRLCRSKRLTPVLSLPPTPPANAFQKSREVAVTLTRFPLNVMRCENCGHHQLDAVVNAHVLFSDYVYASGTSPVFRAHFERYAEEVDRLVAPVRGGRAPRILELGSNDGTFLRALQKRGFATLGVEPAFGLAAEANRNGALTWNGFFTAALAEDVKHRFGPVDAWTANNVLAHIDDFVGTLQALHLCCSDDAVGVFEVQYLERLLQLGAFDMCYHEHLDYWRLTELVAWLPLVTGWRVVDASVTSPHGGSLRVWVRSVNRPPSEHLETVSGLLLGEERGGQSFEQLIKRIEQCRTALLKMLPSGKPTGTVAYGAPAKLSTFVETLGLADRLDYVIDDSPLKQGLFAPGSGLEVRDSTALRTHPKRIVITAWNFADSIVKKLREAGCTSQLIVPFPEVHIVE